MDCPPASVGSTLSWNTFLSRTSVSTLTCAIFSERQGQSVHGLEDVIRAVGSLQLRRYRYEELAREDTLGEGETYLVEKAVHGGAVFAVKHLKINNTPDEKAYRRRLSAVTVEAQIMRHSPLRAHPNLPSVIGYGWNLRGKLIIPFLVVEYAPLGTLREHIQKVAPTLSEVEILLGDVASALAALHACGIVHGDLKLDNVLVFPSMDRPAKALAKLTDFGHALILNDKSKKHVDETVKYGGTVIYNAPEVKTQDLFPIDRTEVWKCDIWAFGLLVWEACIGGQEYTKYLAKSGVVADTSGNDPSISAAEMLHYAKRCLPTAQLGAAMFLRIVLHKTIQEDPLKRAASIRDLPLFTRWNTGNLLGLEADLALHFETPTPTYEMFRLDTGKEILWDHQQQIFQGFQHTHANNLAKQRGPISWQIALCYHTGFGTVKNAQKAYEYSEIAKSDSHPLAMAFGHLLDPHMNGASELPEEAYSARVSSLIRSNPSYSTAMPSLVRAFFDGNSPAIHDLLSDGITLSSSAVDGCSPFHWLFMFQDTALEEIVERLSGNLKERLVNLPMCSAVQIHNQWPLQLLGSPLAVAISVNSLPAVKALLSLGADPFSLVYGQAQFPLDDFRSQWTSFHVAAKYHCSEILAYLLQQTKSRPQTSINSLASVLSLSTSLERLAMHGSNHVKQLDETVRLVRGVQPLGAIDTSGRTGLMVAIDFQDYHVIAALLRGDNEIAKIPFRSPKRPDVFTYPIHFSAQIAARRDVPETLAIPKLVTSYTHGLTSRALSRDYTGKTPLHLAVTGSSSVVAGWILEEDVGMMQIEDLLGRTPLHYCAASASLNLLLNSGAVVNHVDKRGMTALHRLCYLGASDLVTCLLKWKPRLDLRDDIYGTPLHCGVISGSIDVVVALLEGGAPLNAVDINGNTAVHVAVKLNRHNILRVLIQHGADISLRNINGRDPKDIALYAARNFGILSILQHGKKDAHENQSTFEIFNEDVRTFGFGNQLAGNLSRDFLWDEALISVADPDESRNLRQSVNDDLLVYGEQQETYDQRRGKLEKLDEVIGIITRHLPTLYRNREATTAVVRLLSVFFDDIIWHPDIAGRIVEVIARAAHDLAYIVHFYAEKARFIQQRAEAWTEFLTTHNGIFLKHKDQLDPFWDYMEAHDPVEAPDQEGKEPEYRPGNGTCDSGTFQERISLESMLSYIEKTFPFKNKGTFALLNQNSGDVEEVKIRNMMTAWEINMVDGWEVNTEGVWEPKRSSKVEVRREVGRTRKKERRSSAERARRESRLKEASREEPRLDGPSHQEARSYFDHVNLAINWITTVVMARKPQTIFPERQQSDIEDMAQWEVETWKMDVSRSEDIHYSTTLFDTFPQLSEQSWRESSSRDYLKWDHKKAFDFSKKGRPAGWEAQIQFFEKVHSSCIRRMRKENVM